MTTAGRIISFIDGQFAREVAFLAELVKCPSDNPPGDCAPHAERARRLLEGLGFEVEAHDVPQAAVHAAGMKSVTNLIVRHRFGGGPTVALNAHGDVVPPGLGWRHDPYGAIVEEGPGGPRMYGRGVAVSKSDFATYAFALLALRDAAASGAGITGTVELHFTYDEEAGGEIVGAVRFPVANPDFSAFVQRAKDLNPEAIFIFVPGGVQPSAIGKALAERGIDAKKTKVLGMGELTEDEARKTMGDASLGILTVYHYDHNHQSALNREFVKAFNAEYGGRNPNIYSIGGYDGMHLIYEVLKKTGGNADAEALVAAAKGMAWESPRGPISIDPETRDIVQTVYIRRVDKVGGQLLNVEFDKIENVKDPFKARMKK